MKYVKMQRLGLLCLSIILLITMALSGCAKGSNSVTSQTTNATQGESDSIVQSTNQTESSNKDSSTTSSTAISDDKLAAVDIAKSTPVAKLLTNVTIPELSVSLGELFSSEKYYSVEWIDFDTMVKLSVQRQSTSNVIVFCFSKIGDSLDFPQVSTMMSTNNGGTQEVKWSFDNIDKALIELLLAEGYIVDNGGYQAVK